MMSQKDLPLSQGNETVYSGSSKGTLARLLNRAFCRRSSLQSLGLLDLFGPVIRPVENADDASNQKHLEGIKFI